MCRRRQGGEDGREEHGQGDHRSEQIQCLAIEEILYSQSAHIYRHSYIEKLKVNINMGIAISPKKVCEYSSFSI